MYWWLAIIQKRDIQILNLRVHVRQGFFKSGHLHEYGVHSSSGELLNVRKSRTAF